MVPPGGPDTIGAVTTPASSGLNRTAAGDLSVAPATNSTIGGIIVGENLTITAEGVLSAAGGGGSADQVIINPIPGIDTATDVQDALEAIELQVQDRIEFCNVVGGGITPSISAPVRTSNDGTTLTLTVLGANLTRAGIVQLTNDTTGNSETLAVTQKGVAALDGKIDALVGANVLAGTYNSATGVVASTTPAGSAYLTVGSQAPQASALPDNYYLLVTVGGSLGPPGAVIPATGVQSGDWFVVEKEPGVAAAWVTIDFENAQIAALNVSVTPISGLSATNVQAGLQEINTKAQNSFTNITATAADGITVTTTAASATGRTANITLGPATTTDLGGVFVQPNNGITLGANGSIVLTPATATTIGGVKVGSGLSVTADGTISVTGQGQNVTKLVAGTNITLNPPDGTGVVTINSSGGGGGGTAASVIINPIPGIDTADNVQEALEAIELQVQDRIEFCSVVGGGMTASVSTPVRTSNDGTTLTLTTADAGVGTKGMVTLTNDITGTSETLAITQKAAAALDGKVDALVGANVLAGTYNSSTGVVSSVTPAGSSYLIVGSQAPAASNLPDNYYLLVTVAGTQGPPGAVIPGTGVQSGDWFVVEKEAGQPAAWVTIDFENNAVAAVNVSVSAISGLSATNVQTGLQELELKAENSFTNITATAADGIRVTNTPVSANGRTANITLAPATATDLGGVFVQPGQGIDLGANGSLNLTIATASKLGGIKVGTGLAVTADGTLSATSPGGSVTSVAASGGTTGLNFTGTPITTSGTLTLGGVLSVAHGGTGSTTQADAAKAVLPSQTGNAGKVLSSNGTDAIWVTPSTGSVTSVNATGGTTGLSFSGGPITSSGTLTMDGVLSVAHGGTGATTQEAAAAAVLPAQPGNQGKFLTTNGSSVTWGTPPAGTITGVTAGTGLSGGGTTGNVTLNNTGVLSNVAGVGIAVSGATGDVTITNTGVRSLVAGTGIAITQSTGDITVSNTGVTSVVGSNGLSVSGSTGAVTFNFNIADLPALP